MSSHRADLPRGAGTIVSLNPGARTMEGRCRTVAALASGGQVAAAMQAWLALMAESPRDGMEGWFRSIRAVAAHLDVARLHAWLDLTREAILAGAPDRPRVVRHIGILEGNWTREMLDWSGGNGSAARRLARASERTLPRRVVTTPALHQLPHLIGPNSETLVIALPAPAPRPLLEPALEAIRATGMARLGWNAMPLPPPADAALHSLRLGRFLSYGFDDRGGIAFEADHVVAGQPGEHGILHLTGRLPPDRTETGERLAFAIPCADPSDAFLGIVSGLASLAFHPLLPAGTAVIVPKRCERLRPLYEAAGVPWHLVREHAEVETIRFDHVITPAPDASRGVAGEFFRGLVDRFHLDQPLTDSVPILLLDRTAPAPDNAAGIEVVLGRHGVRTLVVQDVGTVALCRLVASSRIVLTASREAAAWIAFARPGTLVLEIIPSRQSDQALRQLASDLALDHLPLPPLDGVAGWQVDPASLDETLALATRRRQPAGEDHRGEADAMPRLMRLVAQNRLRAAAIELGAMLDRRPGEAVDAWFTATRTLGRHLDIGALQFWLEQTHAGVLAHAPDKLRVERYVSLFRDNAGRQIEAWREKPGARQDLRRVEVAEIPRRPMTVPAPGGLLAGLAPGEAVALVLPPRLLPSGDAASDRLDRFQAEQRERLGWRGRPDPVPLPAVELFVLPDVRFVRAEADHRGAILFGGDLIVRELCNEHFMIDMIGHCRVGPEARRLPLAFAPVSACPLNHYHELVDTFSSLAFLPLLPPGTPVVVPVKYEILRPLYEAAGLEWSAILDYGEAADVAFDRVVAPREGASRTFLRDLVQRTLASALVPSRGRVYLSRRRTPARVLENEAAIEALAERHGFIVAHPQEMTAIEQARLLAGAAVVLAPHGAALSNIVFAPTGTVVIELMSPDYKVPAIGELCEACDLLHLPVAGSAFFDPAGGDLRWTVDPDLVEAAICLAIDQAPAGMAIAC